MHLFILPQLLSMSYLSCIIWNAIEHDRNIHKEPCIFKDIKTLIRAVLQWKVWNTKLFPWPRRSSHRNVFGNLAWVHNWTSKLQISMCCWDKLRCLLTEEIHLYKLNKWLKLVSAWLTVNKRVKKESVALLVRVIRWGKKRLLSTRDSFRDLDKNLKKR